MKKITFILILGLALSTFGTMKLSYAATPDTGVTNLQFAQFLIQKLNITLPPGSDKLPQDQYYKAMADALAGKGIIYFQNAALTDYLVSSALGDVLYQIAGGKETLDATGKLNWLVQNGFLATFPVDLNGKVNIDYLNDVFNNPKLSTIIAETYTNPPGPPPGPPGGNSPPGTPENPADNPTSPI